MKYYLFTDPHPTGGQAFIVITEQEILNEYAFEESILSTTEQIHDFVAVNLATEITEDEYLSFTKLATKFLRKEE